MSLHLRVLFHSSNCSHTCSFRLATPGDSHTCILHGGEVRALSLLSDGRARRTFGQSQQVGRLRTLSVRRTYPSESKAGGLVAGKVPWTLRLQARARCGAVVNCSGSVEDALSQ